MKPMITVALLLGLLAALMLSGCRNRCETVCPAPAPRRVCYAPAEVLVPPPPPPRPAPPPPPVCDPCASAPWNLPR